MKKLSKRAISNLRENKFQNSDIDIEPDSIVALNKQEKGISLDLLGGSVKVSQAQKPLASTENSSPSTAVPAPESVPDMALTLSTGKGQIDLSTANATVSKSDGDRINLSVINGKAEVKEADGKSSQIASGQASAITEGKIDSEVPLTVNSPALGTPFYIEADKKSLVTFKWRGTRKDLKVKLLTGDSRNGLKSMASAKTPGDSEISLELPFGKHWFQLVANEPGSGKVAQESSTEAFEVKRAYAPNLTYPASESSLQIGNSPFSLNIEWSSARDAKSTEVEIAKTVSLQNIIFSKSFDSNTHSAQVPLESGEYFVRLSAAFEGMQKPVFSKIVHFSLVKKNPVQIAWRVPKEKLTQLFGEKPGLEVSWEAKNRLPEIARFVLKVEKSAPGGEASKEISVTKNTAVVALVSAGKYLASVDAYDDKGAVIGSSEPLELNALEAPLIPAPKIIAEGEVLHSPADGKMELRWESVPGAKSYRVTVTDASGELLTEQKSEKNSVNIKNLMPGVYTAVLEAVDSYGRKSKTSVTRKIQVPEKSNISPPTLKAITTE